VNALPVVKPIDGINTVCAGLTTLLTNPTSVSEGTGVWSSSNPSVATIDGSGSVTGVTAGIVNINYTVTNSNGCVTAVSYTVRVYGLPPAVVISGANKACVGSLTTLSASGSGGVWSSSDPSVAGIDFTTGGLTGNNAGAVTISYTLTNGNGCINMAAYPFTVNALPLAGTITGTDHVCVGGSVTLSNLTAAAGTVIWSSDSPLIATVNNSGVVSGVAGGIAAIRYTLTDAISGCTSSVTYQITVNTMPAVSAITYSSVSVCAGSVMSLSDATVGGIWSSSDVSKATIDAAGMV